MIFSLNLPCSISCRTLCSPLATFCGCIRGHGAWGLSRWGNTRGRQMSVFIYKPKEYLRAIIMGQYHKCIILVAWRLRLLQSLDVEENPWLRAFSRLCHTVYGNILHLHKNLSDFLSLPKMEIDFLSTTFLRLWFHALVNRCSCSKVRLIIYVGWICMCVKAFWHIDIAVMSVVVVKS